MRIYILVFANFYWLNFGKQSIFGDFRSLGYMTRIPNFSKIKIKHKQPSNVYQEFWEVKIRVRGSEKKI